ncbi:MAG: RICIN domain-containing protein [Ruminococcus sp.]
MKRVKAFLTALLMLTAMPLTYQGIYAEAASAASVPEGTYLIRNVNSGIYLDVAGGAEANGTNVQQWGADSGQPNNVWKIVAEADGYYSIYSMVGGGNTYRLSVGTGENADDTNICIYEKKDSDTQLYRFFGNEDGSYRILAKSSNNAKAVEVVNAETASGANVQIWETNGVSCQNWELIPIGYTDEHLTETAGTMTHMEFHAGDLNDDGKLNVFDMVLFRQMLLENSGTQKQKYAANVNGDDSVTMADAVVMQKYLTGKGGLQKQYVPVQRNYKAVSGQFTQGTSETVNAGFESDAYLNLDNAKDVRVSWNVAADSDGVYAVTIRYANGGTTSRDMALTVNHEIVCWNVAFPTTGSWTAWDTVTVYLPLKEGINQLTATSLTEDGAPNMDHIMITETQEQESPSLPIAPIAATPSKQPEKNYGTPGVGKQMETLDRGVTAAYTGSGMLVSWRSLATDDADTTFKLYQNGTFVADIGADDPTNYFVAGATSADSFTIDTFVDGTMIEFAQAATILGTKNAGQSGAYMDIPMNKPADQTMPDGTTCTYTPNDCSVGDVDGDGQYEIIVKWDPSNSQDNAKDGYTGTVYLDCYELDGTQLWRIDLGINIRAGAHYTQYMVYDFDGDGKAELICKTSDNTWDGTGKVIGDASADYRGTNGRILTGNEYLTLFDGQTGAALDTIDYEPVRGNVSDWGDTYGNRVDRFLAGVAYLDGETPSAVFCRGYYTRTAIVAYDVVNKKIVKRWSFDTGNDKTNAYYGQGNHSLVVMDVDADGKDEIVYGSCCIDDNGKGLWSTGLGHGDCMQAGDLIPERPGLEIFQVHEEVWCAEIHDAATGEIIWRVDGSDDVGRGIALNLSSEYAGMEFASIADGMIYAYNASTGKIESTGTAWTTAIKWGMNAAAWWDGDLEREALDRTMLEKWGQNRIFTGNANYNNGSKSNASLTCDLFGDWREELIFPAEDGTKLRIFTTTYATDIKLFTLMHDSQYRTGVAIENVGYNQAPNTSFFLGTGYDLPDTPVIYTIPPQK